MWWSTSACGGSNSRRRHPFADVLLAMPQDDGEFSRADVRMRDLKL
jgi:hypothetical protein